MTWLSQYIFVPTLGHTSLFPSIKLLYCYLFCALLENVANSGNFAHYNNCESLYFVSCLFHSYKNFLKIGMRLQSTFVRCKQRYYCNNNTIAKTIFAHYYFIPQAKTLVIFFKSIFQITVNKCTLGATFKTIYKSLRF